MTEKTIRTINVTLPVWILERVVRLNLLDDCRWDERDAKALEWAQTSIRKAKEAAHG